MSLLCALTESPQQEAILSSARCGGKLVTGAFLFIGFVFGAFLSNAPYAPSENAKLLIRNPPISLAWQPQHLARAQPGQHGILQRVSQFPRPFRKFGMQPKPSTVMRSYVPDDPPECARDAIILGDRMVKEGDAKGALAIFQKGFSLWGSGTKRDRKKPRELSEGEKVSLHYNMACCFSILGEEYYDEALKSLTAAFQEGFREFDQLNEDPDLKNLREGDPAGFKELVDFWKPKTQGFGSFFR